MLPAPSSSRSSSVVMRNPLSTKKSATPDAPSSLNGRTRSGSPGQCRQTTAVIAKQRRASSDPNLRTCANRSLGPSAGVSNVRGRRGLTGRTFGHSGCSCAPNSHDLRHASGRQCPRTAVGHESPESLDTFVARRRRSGNSASAERAAAVREAAAMFAAGRAHWTPGATGSAASCARGYWVLGGRVEPIRCRGVPDPNAMYEWAVLPQPNSRRMTGLGHASGTSCPRRAEHPEEETRSRGIRISRDGPGLGLGTPIVPGPRPVRHRRRRCATWRVMEREAVLAAWLG